MTERVSPLLAAMTGAGGVVSDYQGAQVVRHFGDPSAEYAAATEKYTEALKMNPAHEGASRGRELASRQSQYRVDLAKSY